MNTCLLTVELSKTALNPCADCLPDEGPDQKLIH